MVEHAETNSFAVEQTAETTVETAEEFTHQPIVVELGDYYFGRCDPCGFSTTRGSKIRSWVEDKLYEHTSHPSRTKKPVDNHHES